MGTIASARAVAFRAASVTCETRVASKTVFFTQVCLPVSSISACSQLSTRIRANMGTHHTTCRLTSLSALHKTWHRKQHALEHVMMIMLATEVQCKECLSAGAAFLPRRREHEICLLRRLQIRDQSERETSNHEKYIRHVRFALVPQHVFISSIKWRGRPAHDSRLRGKNEGYISSRRMQV